MEREGWKFNVNYRSCGLSTNSQLGDSTSLCSKWHDQLEMSLRGETNKEIFLPPVLILLSFHPLDSLPLLLPTHWFIPPSVTTCLLPGGRQFCHSANCCIFSYFFIKKLGIVNLRTRKMPINPSTHGGVLCFELLMPETERDAPGVPKVLEQMDFQVLFNCCCPLTF